MESVEIVACTDHRFIMPVGVMMHSVCRNNCDLKVCFHVIIDESVTKDDKADLRDIASGMNVSFYNADSKLFSSMPLVPGLSNATYYRLLIPQILPERINKVLYLDGDIIVRHSVLPLWETDLEGFAIAAVTDADESLIEKYNRQKYSPKYGHFNAGVMLINLKYWRANNTRREIESYIENHSESIRYCDQDILNYVLRTHKITLPITYNTQTGFLWVTERACYDYWKYEEEVIEARKDPVILHFTHGKPWVKGTEHPYRGSFVKYQGETKWKGEIWEKPKRLQRPFWTRVLSHTFDAMEKILIKMRLIKGQLKQRGNNVILDLPPID